MSYCDLSANKSSLSLVNLPTCPTPGSRLPSVYITLEGQQRPLVLPLFITVRNEASRLRVTEHVHDAFYESFWNI